MRFGFGPSPHYQVHMVASDENFRIATSIQSGDGSEVEFLVRSPHSGRTRRAFNGVQSVGAAAVARRSTTSAATLCNPGRGIHDSYMNQGNPAPPAGRAQWFADNGPWKDWGSCSSSHARVAVFLKLQSQA
jgi:uncharacterized protein YukJ